MVSPLVSVVIPTFNRAYHIGKTVASVLEQTHHRLEAIIVDDGSTDNTPDVIRAIRDRRVKYHRFHENRGHPVRMRFGLERVRGDFFVFLGSDDRLAGPTILTEALVELDSADEDVWVVTYLVESNARPGMNSQIEREVIDLAGYFRHPKLLHADFFHVYRRRFLDAFLELYTEPYTFFTAFLDVYLKHGCRQVVIPQVGLVAGFYGDNVTKGQGGSRYDLWAEQCALHHFRRFRSYAPARGTEWWRDRLLSTIFWTGSSRRLPFRARTQALAEALASYVADFGLDTRCLSVAAAALLPFGVGRKARHLRDMMRTDR